MLFPYMCNVNNRTLDLDDLSDLTDFSSDDESDNEEDFRPRSERSALSALLSRSQMRRFLRSGRAVPRMQRLIPLVSCYLS